jgi:hypothetical protein
MKLLRELLNEAQEKNLIGLNISGKLITPETKDKKWTGDFYCFDNELTSLTGAPTSVTGNFYCYDNKLTSLTGAPTTVTGNFDCSDNELTSLTGAPTTVTGNFYCYDNKLTSLTGAPTTVTGDFDCSDNRLTSLTGAPASVTGNFYCGNSKLTSLTGAPASVGGHFDCSGNKLTSLKDVHKQIKSIGGTFYLIKNPLKSHVLGLLKIKGLKSVELDNKKVEKILNKYLPEGDLFDCQEELIDAGLDDYAQL